VTILFVDRFSIGVVRIWSGFAEVSRGHPELQLEIVGDDRTYPPQDLAQVVREARPAIASAFARNDDTALDELYAQARAFAFLSERRLRAHAGGGDERQRTRSSSVRPCLAKRAAPPPRMWRRPMFERRALERTVFDEAFRAQLLDAAPAVGATGGTQRRPLSLSSSARRHDAAHRSHHRHREFQRQGRSHGAWRHCSNTAGSPARGCLVDNGSSDGTLEAVRIGGLTCVIEMGRNAASAPPIPGIRSTESDLILLLNSDTVVPAGRSTRSSRAARIHGWRSWDRDSWTRMPARLSFGPMIGPFAELRRKIVMARASDGSPAVWLVSRGPGGRGAWTGSAARACSSVATPRIGGCSTSGLRLLRGRRFLRRDPKADDSSLHAAC
jgi:hypothetical protein